MSQIQIKDLTFYYEGSYDLIFEHVSFTLDTDWKLGLIGRNGRGKTTLLNLLLGKFSYSGTITKSVEFDYFPFQVEEEKKEHNTIELIEEWYPQYEFWKLCRELNYLKVEADVLYRPFSTLSNGEQTKIMLAILFLRENHFLLIDEPTNHLDQEGRELVADYLRRKKGYILVSHDRYFLDRCIDHVMAINKQNIDVVQGNFTSWYENKRKQEESEVKENERLKKEITRLEEATRRTKNWSDHVEKTKIGRSPFEAKVDRGYIGHQAAKMMKRSKGIQDRANAQIEKKKELMKNIEQMEALKIYPLSYHKKELCSIKEGRLYYGETLITEGINATILQGEVTVLEGKNGCGKSTFLKAFAKLANGQEDGEDIKVMGEQVNVQKGLVISYVPQDTSFLKGSLDEYMEQWNMDPTIFKMLLRKLDFSREQFEKPMESYSAGQKKKVLLARSLSEKAHIYIWDEPLNYIDIFSRIQIEELIKKNHLTMILVEHDKTFTEHLGDQIIRLKRVSNDEKEQE